MNSNKLNPRQQRFLWLYLKLGNASEALRQAGYKTRYPDRYGAELLAKPFIQEELGKTREILTKELKATVEWKREKLIRVIAEYIPTDTNTPLNPLQARIAIAAMNELNHMDGTYAPSKAVNLNVSSTIDLLKDARIQYKEF